MTQEVAKAFEEQSKINFMLAKDKSIEVDGYSGFVFTAKSGRPLMPNGVNSVLSVGYLCRHVPAFKGLEHSISYTIFAMLFIFGITIGANQSLLNNIGEFGIQAAILAICGVLGSLVASFIAYKLFIKKGGLNEK